MYGANHNSVGFVCILALRVLALLSNCVLAGSIPLLPYNPESEISHGGLVFSHDISNQSRNATNDYELIPGRDKDCIEIILWVYQVSYPTEYWCSFLGSGMA